jgi:hypothetical protein
MHCAMNVRTLRMAAAALVVSVGSTGCFGYRLMRPEEIDVPSYEAREVLVPEQCDALVRRAATSGIEGMRRDEIDMIDFCQNQQILRSQEEEAVARKLEAHAQAASFALRLTTLVVGSLIAILAWAF